MDAVERCPRLESLNGCSQIKQIMAGGVHVVDIDGKDLAFVVGPLLPRSASTLTMLSMRSDGFATSHLPCGAEPLHHLRRGVRLRTLNRILQCLDL
jgi:hypothetical protein